MVYCFEGNYSLLLPNNEYILYFKGEVSFPEAAPLYPIGIEPLFREKKNNKKNQLMQK